MTTNQNSAGATDLSEEQVRLLKDRAYREQVTQQQAFTTSQLAMVAKQLETDLDLNPVTRVSYADFVRNGLPILQTVHGEFDAGAWIQYVGQAYVSLEVIDTDGSVKYTVPSMYRQLETPAGNFDERYHDHTSELLSIRVDSPEVASRYQFNVLSRAVGSNVDEEIEDGVRALNAVNKIFSDHGIPVITIDGLGAMKPIDADALLDDPAIIVVDENNNFNENIEEL